MVANGSAAAVSATHVSFRHKGASAGYALDDLELEVPAGEVVVLCGRSGCGKTTVTRLLNGLIPQFYEGDCGGARTCWASIRPSSPSRAWQPSWAACSRTRAAS